jgi:Tol biopolymer transport system component
MAKTRSAAVLWLTTSLAVALFALSAIGVLAAVGIGWLVRGEMVVASASRYGPYNARVGSIELVDLRRGTTGQLAARVVDFSYTPSPDHHYLAYVVTDGSRRRCEVRDLADVMTVIFSSDPAQSCAIPIWSGDSKRLVAVADLDNSWRVTVFDRESRRVRSVFLNNAPFIWTTSASPDGRRVAFVSRYGDPLSVWVLDTITLDLTLLDTPGRQDDFQDIQGNAWSPDGRWLVVVADYVGYSLLFVLDTVGGTMRLVDESEVAYGPVSWSPAGQPLPVYRRRAVQRKRAASGIRRVQRLAARSNNTAARSFVRAVVAGWQANGAGGEQSGEL